ncbi:MULTISPECIES: DUF4013 domain-containing protein [Halococcus]|uniref:DUF4013 domain-containing protein n=1 Tax=Halococcus salifodinae DSM 8989 TaxID=1227456 RepID=M0N4I6_9EURY|nr:MULTISPECIES: DUF4013 domain-containing protein [Halococcus]EMA52458.1 hypothetical protein C450_10173 [Halococcus salifodinae DSM 8989]
MISDALNYLRNSDDALVTVLIGGLLSVFGFLLIPVFFVNGYLVRVLRRTAAGDETAPVFDDWGRMGIEGLKATVIAIVYGFVPFVVGAVLVGGSAVAIATGGSVDGGSAAVGAGVLGLLVGLAITFVLGLAAWYVIPAATANFAERGTLAAAFDFGTLRPILFSGAYATGWLLALGVIVGGGIIAGAFNAVIPILGAVPGLFVSFYASVAAYYVIGRTWADLRTVETRETADEQPAV